MVDLLNSWRTWEVFPGVEKECKILYTSLETQFLFQDNSHRSHFMIPKCNKRLHPFVLKLPFKVLQSHHEQVPINTLSEGRIFCSL